MCVGQDGIILAGRGLLRADYILVEELEEAVNSIKEPEADEDQGPTNLKNGLLSMINVLTGQMQGGQHAFATGTRAEIKRAIELVGEGNLVAVHEYLGVDKLGSRRTVDFVVNENGEHVLVEYKHWNGTGKANEIADHILPNRLTRFQNQIGGYIQLMPDNNYKTVTIDWPLFGTLGPATQAEFRRIFVTLQRMASEKGVRLITP